MAKTLLINSSEGATITQQGYISVADGHFSNSSTEAPRQVPFYAAGTFSRLRAYVSANTRSVAYTATLRDDGNNTSLVCTIASATTGAFEDSSNTATIASGSYMSVFITSAAGTGSATFESMSVLLDVTGEAVKRYLYFANTSYSASGGVTNFALSGGSSGGSALSETNCRFDFNAEGTLENLGVYVSTNNRTTDTTWRVRKNGANGNQVVTVSAASTGYFEDTTNIDVVTLNDDFCYQQTFGASSESLVSQMISTEFHGRSSEFHFIAGRSITSPSLGFGATGYVQLGGLSGATTQSAEAEAQTKAQMPLRLSNLYIRVQSNSVNGTTNVTLRKNGAGTSVTVAVGSSTTGEFEDTTHTEEAIFETDLLCYQIAAGGSSGAISTGLFGCKATQMNLLELNSPTYEDTFYGTVFSQGPNPTHVQLNFGGWGDIYHSYLKFDVNTFPQYARIQQVKLWMYCQPSVNDPVAHVRRVTSAWQDTALSSSNLPTDDATNRGSFPTLGGGSARWVSVDITQLVKDWISLTSPNYGLKVHSTVGSNQNNGYCHSRDNSSGNAPYLEVITIDAAVTKSLKYAIVKEIGITKSLRYAILDDNAITKSLKYAVKKAVPTTKSLRYAVKKVRSITKSLKYTVLDANAITKSARYAIKKTYGITKSLTYKVTDENAITKSLKYTVVKAVAITKSLKYAVLIDNGAVQKSLTYEVSTKIYSREVRATLPTDTTILATIYSAGEIDDVADNDDVFVELETAEDDRYLIHNFGYIHTNSTDPITVRIRAKAAIAPSVSNVLLQIWNFDTEAWETIDTEAAVGSETEFELLGSKNASLSPDYYSPENMVVARIYQQK